MERKGHVPAGCTCVKFQGGGWAWFSGALSSSAPEQWLELLNGMQKVNGACGKNARNGVNRTSSCGSETRQVSGWRVGMVFEGAVVIAAVGGQRGATIKGRMKNNCLRPPLTLRKNHPRGSVRVEPENRCIYLAGSRLRELPAGCLFSERENLFNIISNYGIFLVNVFTAENKNIYNSLLCLNRFS